MLIETCHHDAAMVLEEMALSKDGPDCAVQAVQNRITGYEWQQHAAENSWIKITLLLGYYINSKGLIYICHVVLCGGTALQAGRSRVRFPVVSLKMFINIILPAALCPWSRLSL